MIWNGYDNIWGTGSFDGNGNYTFTGFNSQPVGAYTVYATSAGDANYSGVWGSTTLTINKAIPNTLTQVSSDVFSLNYGQNVTFSTLVNTGGGIPTGTMAFFDGGSQIGNGSISATNATNLVAYSQQIGNSASWGGYCGSLSNATANTSDLTAPDGSPTATKWFVDGPVCGSPSGTSNGAISYFPGGITTGQTYTVSAWLRGAQGGEYVNLGLNDCAQYGVQLTTSWVRYSHTFSSIPDAISECATGPRGLEFTGANETYYIWGAQVEQSATVGPYIQTDAAARSGSGGMSTFTTNTLSQGTHAIAASYSGDSGNNGSSSSTLSIEVLQPLPAVPAISSISTASGAQGTPITIVGSNFGVSQGSNTITFNGVLGTPTSWSDTTIVVPVPGGATSGNIVVTVNGNASNGVAFVVPPIINGVTPNSGPANTSVKISGRNFGSSVGTVTFNGTPAATSFWSDSTITVTVPQGASSGFVVVNAGGTNSNGVRFRTPVPASCPVNP